MVDSEKDFVEIAGVPPVAGWWSEPNSSLEVPKRRIELPIEIKMPRWRMWAIWPAGIGLICFLGLFSTITLSNVRTFYLEGYCVGKRNTHEYGMACFSHMLIGVMGVILLTYILIKGLDNGIVLVQASVRSGSHLKITRDEFWHVQLAEPIRFSDVVEYHTETYKTAPVGCVLKCKSRPQLSFWSLFNSRMFFRSGNDFYFWELSP